MTGSPRKIDPFDVQFIQVVADVLAQTAHTDLTNSEIDVLLQMVRVKAREPGANKRDSLFVTLNNTQFRQGAGNVVSAFISRAMAPSRYARDPNRFRDLRDQLNEAIVFYGWTVNEEGRLKRGKQAKTMREGQLLAGRLRTELVRRGTHVELLRYCEEEFVSQSLFHGLSEAAKSIPVRIRSMTGLAGDGEALYTGVFGSRESPPLLVINGYATDSDISEHRGFKNLLTGIHGHYRNPRAHGSRVDFDESITDFYDAFSLFSYVHRRLDAARRRS